MAANPQPSFWLKLDRADHHLKSLRVLIDAYAASHPYTVSAAIEGQGKHKRLVHRLHFTNDPPLAVALIAADFIYNLRSGLDHLNAALLPAKQRDSGMFPIFFNGVWEPGLPGENLQRLKDRSRWAGSVKGMAPEAVAILKRLQPQDDVSAERGEFHALSMINRLSNTDRHKTLPVHIQGLRDYQVSYATTTGALVSRSQALDPNLPRGRSIEAPSQSLGNGAELKVPEGAVDVQIKGTSAISIRLAQKTRKLPQAGVLIPEGLEWLWRFIRDEIYVPL